MSDGLNLGPLPFSPGRQPYTPPERRRRKAGPAAASGPAPRPPRKPRAAAIGWESTGHVPFLGVQRGRIRGALGASFASHLFGAALVLLVVGTAPVEEIFEERTSYDIVWIPQAGPGGGGGGGGNESLEMPRQVEALGEDAIDVPVEVPEEVEAPPEVEPEPEPEPLESQNIQLSAVPMAASPQTRTGLLEGLLSGALDSAGSGTDGGAGEGSGGGIGPGQGDGLGPGEGGGTGGGVFRPGNGVEIPRMLRNVTPNYTAEAMRAKVQGVVLVEAVVLPDGSVGEVTVIRSLDKVFGLDEEAVKAARQMRFLPGTRFGEPVAVLVTIELSFALR